MPDRHQKWDFTLAGTTFAFLRSFHKESYGFMRFGTAMGSTLQRKRKCARFTSLRKQPTFGDATTEFPAKWRLRNERRNSSPMTRHYPDLGSASDLLNQISHAARPIWSTTEIWVLRRHQYGISALVSQTSFRWETSGGVAKCPLFFQVISLLALEERTRGSIWMKEFSQEMVLFHDVCMVCSLSSKR